MKNQEKKDFKYHLNTTILLSIIIAFISSFEDRLFDETFNICAGWFVNWLFLAITLLAVIIMIRILVLIVITINLFLFKWWRWIFKENDW